MELYIRARLIEDFEGIDTYTVRGRNAVDLIIEDLSSYGNYET